MYETYQNLKKLALLWEGSTDLDEVCEHYQQTQDPLAFSYIFEKVWRVSVSVANKFWGLTDSDKASLITEELHKSLLNYSKEQTATVQNFFSIYLKRRFYAETNMLNHQKRKANLIASCYDDFVDIMKTSNDTNLDITELNLTLQGAEYLNQREKEYCQLVVSTTGEPIRDSDAAEMMGVSSAAIHYLRKRLETKLQPELLY